jgi:hypothetical protein
MLLEILAACDHALPSYFRIDMLEDVCISWGTHTVHDQILRDDVNLHPVRKDELKNSGWDTNPSSALLSCTEYALFEVRYMLRKPWR